MRLARIIREIVDHVKDRVGTFILTVAELQYMVTSALTVTKAVTRIQTHVLCASGKEWCIMTREIKFRGLYKGTWVYGNLIQGTFEGKPFTQIEQSDNSDFAKWEVSAESVGQYTGLKDKNGKEIYEGDCLEGANEVQYVVEFDNGSFIGKVTGLFRGDKATWDRGYSLRDFELISIEVIENIHQNPELL